MMRGPSDDPIAEKLVQEARAAPPDGEYTISPEGYLLKKGLIYVLKIDVLKVVVL
jgi:hypothetical protein